MLDPISVKPGVKQGDLLTRTLSAIFFKIIILQAFSGSYACIYIQSRTTEKHTLFYYSNQNLHIF